VRFSLIKWYIDVVTGDGRVAIAYWTAVRAGRMRHGVCGLLRSDGANASRVFTVRGAGEPRLDGDRLVWSAPPLALEVELLRLAPAISHRLLDSPDGAVDWQACAPAAHVRLAVAGEVLEGAGYAERLEVTIAPWALPLRTLHWGRWVADARSLVWIVWEGPHPLALAWLDGVLVEDPRVLDDGLSLGDAGRLVLADRTVITDATVGEQLAVLAPLRRLVERVSGSHQTRWRSRGTFTAPGTAALTGWTVHEVVRWR